MHTKSTSPARRFRPVLPLALAVLAVLAGPVRAEVPRVMVDTVPLHALVSRVMAGVGAPDLLITPGASPHDFQLRPSDAGRLAAAQVVIWSGEALAPWLADPLMALAPQALTLEVLETDGWSRLDLRTDAAFAAAEAEAHDHQGEAEGEGAHHDHEGTDPHAWLDPAVAAVWLGQIAGILAQADPAHASAYRANAQAGAAEMAALQAELAAVLAPVQGRAYIVPHDAYQYFEVAFGVPALGAITLSDAASPGPARIAALRDLVATGDVACILTDPQTSPEWTAVLAQGIAVRTAQTDPDGSTFAPGAELYPAMLRALAAALVDCTAP